MEYITDIQNHVSYYIHSRDINIYSEGVSMCHGIVELIKINTFNLRTPIFKVACNKYP